MAAGNEPTYGSESYHPLGKNLLADGFSPGQLSALRVIFALLSAAMFSMIFYTCWTDGSPFRPGMHVFSLLLGLTRLHSISTVSESRINIVLHLCCNLNNHIRPGPLNLTTEHTELLTPWMVATLWDFYTNQFVIFCWACYKEDSMIQRILVLIFMICLGSLTSCLYVLWQLFKLSP